MNRRHLVTWMVLGAIGAVLLCLFLAKKARYERGTPAWRDDPVQPSEGLAAGMGVLSPAESLAANGCPPPMSCCTGYTAGMRTRRTWPDHLVDVPDSLIHALIEVDI